MVEEIGILPSQYIRSLVDSRAILNVSSVKQVQPASFEPTLGDKCYTLNASRLPSGDDRVSDRIKNEEYLYEVDLNKPGGVFVHPNTLVLVPLNEEFDFPSGYMGCATAKSSLGRIGILVRLLTDDHNKYDTIPDGYKGKLYLEIYSRYFPLRISKGLSLIQIIFAYRSFASLDEAMLKLLHKKHPLLFNSSGGALDIERVRIQNSKLLMHISLPENSMILRAKHHVPEAIDLSRNFSNEGSKYLISKFWDEVAVNTGVVAPPNELHLAVTKEFISIPLNYVTLMASFNPILGRLNPHEAGLFNPGHGYGKGEGKGFAPVLEVTTFDMPHTLRDSDPICAIGVHKLIQPSDMPYDFRPNRTGQGGINPGKFFKKD